MGFHPSRLRRGELLAGVCAALLLVLMLAATWYRRPSGSLTGWQALTDLRWLALVTIVAAFGLVLLQATRRAPALPSAMSLLVAVIGLVNALAFVYRVLVNMPAHQQVGAYLGLASAAGIAYAGYRSLRQEGVADMDQPHDIPVVRLGVEDEPRIEQVPRPANGDE